VQENNFGRQDLIGRQSDTTSFDQSGHFHDYPMAGISTLYSEEGPSCNIIRQITERPFLG
jgi:hypothetical protein